MTIRSPRNLLFIVPLCVAAGIVVACGPYEPGCKPTASTCPPGISAPFPAAYNPPPMAPVQPQNSYILPTPVLPPITAVPIWNLTIVDGKLHQQTGDGLRCACEKLTILVNGAEPVQVSVAGKEIKLVGGKDQPGSDILAASAERVSRSGADGALLSLEGNVKLVYARGGKKVEGTADKVSLNLLTGQVVTDVSPPPQVSYPPTPSVQPTGQTKLIGGPSPAVR